MFIIFMVVSLVSLRPQLALCMLLIVDEEGDE